MLCADSLYSFDSYSNGMQSGFTYFNSCSPCCRSRLHGQRLWSPTLPVVRKWSAGEGAKLSKLVYWAKVGCRCFSQLLSLQRMDSPLALSQRTTGIWASPRSRTMIARGQKHSIHLRGRHPGLDSFIRIEILPQLSAALPRMAHPKVGAPLLTCANNPLAADCFTLRFKCNIPTKELGRKGAKLASCFV